MTILLSEALRPGPSIKPLSSFLGSPSHSKDLAPCPGGVVNFQLLTSHRPLVTFSYTAAFWTWEEWETQLNWLALHGANLPLAWVGQEKILIDVFRGWPHRC